MVLCSLTSFILTRLYCHSAKSAEPPPPYPPPQPFVSLTAEAVKNQIGLLRGYFEHRLAGLDTLLDDPQNPAQAKLGPLGQVIRPSSAAIAAGGGSKKKAKPKDGTTAALAPGVIAGPATGAVTTGSTVAGASVGVMSGVVAGVIQPATPTLSSAGLLSPLGIGVDRPVSNGHGGNPCWLSATTGADTEEEESCTRSGHWRGRRCGSWDWWGWRYGQEARTAARGSATGCRSERVSLMRLEWSGRRSYFFGVVTYYCQFFVIYFCTL